MSSPRYDFVGVSSTQLPYVHDSFPAGPKVGTVRYYTMRSMHRGKDAERKNAFGLRRSQSLKVDNKQMADLKLPKLDFDTHHGGNISQNSYHRKKVDISSTTGNIYKQKAYFRSKGIPINQVYSLYRTKPDRLEHLNKKIPRATDLVKSKSPSMKHNLKWLPPPPRLETTPTESVIETEDSYETDSRDSPLRKSRLEEMDRESPVPGVLPFKKSKHGRKLGNIVSSRRLQQLLDSSDPLDLGDFYYY